MMIMMTMMMMMMMMTMMMNKESRSTKKEWQYDAADGTGSLDNNGRWRWPMEIMDDGTLTE